jgi:Dehydrogenases with different specificities (related to short-chain alcohol dehydrogenases)
MRVNLSGEIALVTGGARGIGQAIATAFSENGAKVIVADIDVEAAAKVAAELPGAEPLRMDVASPDEVKTAVDAIVRQHGRLDILVNNAGLNTLDHRVTVEEFPLEEWDRIVAVDLRGLFIVSKQCSQVMVRQKRGRIINISSVLGIVPARLQCAFVAAKAGVINLTRAMAIELAGRGIAVNCVAPGSTVTDSTRDLFYGTSAVMQANVRQLIAHIPMGRPAEAMEIAHAVLFFAAPESSYTTGQVLSVDGGWSAGGFLRDF